MNLVISGYGKMGKEVQNAAEQRGHHIGAILDNEADWLHFLRSKPKADVVIDFSMPKVALTNMMHCFSVNLPIVTGTTGWHEQYDEVVAACSQHEAALFYAPNFSLGVNIFFEANKLLAKLTSAVEGYKIRINETHHKHKLDAPSGTAIRAAEDIISQFPSLTGWGSELNLQDNILPVSSERKGEVTGFHELIYESEVDRITLSHDAKNRSGFALGALLAAEFIIGRKGVYTMKDLLQTMGA